MENVSSILPSRTGSGQANNILLKEDGNFINEKKALAELFNDYFENILEDANEITEMDYGISSNIQVSEQ